MNTEKVEGRGSRAEGRAIARRALTLIELLVVIIILTIVVAAAIPIMSPADADREIREATRGLNTYITGAQTRAVATRRPFGIALKRLSADTGNINPISTSNPTNDNGVCLEVYYVEQQPPYAGFSPNSRACVGYLRQASLTLWYIRFVCPGNTVLPNVDRLPAGWDGDLFPGFTVQPGDIVEIGGTRYLFKSTEQIRQPTGKGTYYFPESPGVPVVELEIVPINDTGQLVSVEYDNLGRPLRDGPYTQQPPQKRYWSAPTTYKILRQPTKTSDPPYQLPEGTAIDLRASGIGSSANLQFFHYPQPTNLDSHPRSDNSEPVHIMFTPEGRVDTTYYVTNLPTPSTTLQSVSETRVDNIYLLVGKRENIPAPLVSADKSLNPSNSTGWGGLATEQDRQEAKEPINWLNGQSRWVVIGSQSGRVVSVENTAVDPAAIFASTNPLPPAPSTELMRTRQILNAREFTFDMANMGGR